MRQRPLSTGVAWNKAGTRHAERFHIGLLLLLRVLGVCPGSSSQFSGRQPSPLRVSLKQSDGLSEAPQKNHLQFQEAPIHHNGNPPDLSRSLHLCVSTPSSVCSSIPPPPATIQRIHKQQAPL